MTGKLHTHEIIECNGRKANISISQSEIVGRTGSEIDELYRQRKINAYRTIGKPND